MVGTETQDELGQRKTQEVLGYANTKQIMISRYSFKNVKSETQTNRVEILIPLKFLLKQIILICENRD